MANYGPPGGRYPGPSQQPWPERQPPDQYGQPSDPWGGQDQPGGPDQPGGQGHWGGQDEPGYGQSPHYQAGSPPGGAGPAWASPGADPAWSPSGAEPSAKRGGSRLFVVVLAALAVLVCGGGAAGVYLFSENERTPVVQPTTGPTGGPTEEPSARAEAAPSTPDPSTDARFVKAGQCVKNEGSDEKPRLAIVNCAPQAYEVVARINGSTTGEEDAKAKCAKVENYTNFYYFNSELDELDFVLCLKIR